MTINNRTLIQNIEEIDPYYKKKKKNLIIFIILLKY